MGQEEYQHSMQRVVPSETQHVAGGVSARYEVGAAQAQQGATSLSAQHEAGVEVPPLYIEHVADAQPLTMDYLRCSDIIEFPIDMRIPSNSHLTSLTSFGLPVRAQLTSISEAKIVMRSPHLPLGFSENFKDSKWGRFCVGLRLECTQRRFEEVSLSDSSVPCCAMLGWCNLCQVWQKNLGITVLFTFMPTPANHHLSEFVVAQELLPYLTTASVVRFSPSPPSAERHIPLIEKQSFERASSVLDSQLGIIEKYGKLFLALSSSCIDVL